MCCLRAQSQALLQQLCFRGLCGLRRAHKNAEPHVTPTLALWPQSSGGSGHRALALHLQCAEFLQEVQRLPTLCPDLEDPLRHELERSGGERSGKGWLKALRGEQLSSRPQSCLLAEATRAEQTWGRTAVVAQA